MRKIIFLITMLLVLPNLLYAGGLSFGWINAVEEDTKKLDEKIRQEQEEKELSPVAPSNLSVTALSSSQIDLNWQDNSDNEDGFKIERKSSAGGTYTQIDTAIANVTSYRDTGLSINTKYYYRVRAYNTAGDSDYSNEAYATTAGVAPSPPSNLSAKVISSSRIDLTWQDNSDNEDGFKIERKAGEGGTYSQIDFVGINITSYSDTGLSAKTQYYYQVRSYNTVGNSTYSNEAYATTFDVAPSPPGSLSATAVSSSQIDLTWQDNSNNEEGFKIERKIGAGGTYTQIDTVGANTTSYSDIGLSAKTEYYYRVRAYNTVGNSAYSNEVNVTTAGIPPAAPSNLSLFTVSPTQVYLSWKDNSNNEDGFKIERKTGVDGTYTVVGTRSANIETWKDSGRTEATLYYYRVRAYSEEGFSSYCEEASIRTFKAYDSPGSSPEGLAWDGTNLWSCDGNSYKTYRHNMDAALSVAETYSNDATGLAWDGTNLWSCDDYSSIIRKHNMDDTLSVAEIYDSPALYPGALTWDGNNIWSGTSHHAYDDIYKHNMDDTLSVAASYSLELYPQGLAWDGTNLWSCTRGKIYKHNIDATLSVAETYDSPGDYPSGLAWDGANLWSCDYSNDKIYGPAQ